MCSTARETCRDHDLHSTPTMCHDQAPKTTGGMQGHPHTRKDAEAGTDARHTGTGGTVCGSLSFRHCTARGSSSSGKLTGSFTSAEMCGLTVDLRGHACFIAATSVACFQRSKAQICDTKDVQLATRQTGKEQRAPQFCVKVLNAPVRCFLVVLRHWRMVRIDVLCNQLIGHHLLA